METIQVILFFFGFLFLVELLNYINQDVKTFEDYIISYLNKFDLELIKVEIPPFLNTGPFPFFNFEIQNNNDLRSQRLKNRNISIIRIVTYKNEKGEIYTSWVKINRNNKGKSILWDTIPKKVKKQLQQISQEL